MRRNTATALSPVVVKVMPVKLFKAMVREDGFLQASAPCHHTTAKVCVCVCVCVGRERERLTSPDLPAGRAEGVGLVRRGARRVGARRDAGRGGAKGDGQMTRRAREAQG